MTFEHSNHPCRVCGYIPDDPPWGLDEKSPTFDICSCCGVEFGYGDCTVQSIRTFRQRWLEKGGVWRFVEDKPNDWSLIKQLESIPEKYL